MYYLAKWGYLHWNGRVKECQGLLKRDALYGKEYLPRKGFPLRN